MSLTNTTSAFAALDLADPAVNVERRADGSMILRSPQQLKPYPRCLGDILVDRATRHPERIFLAERDSSGGWRRISYGETLALVRALGQALLDLGCTQERGVAILSGNSIDHALLTLAAMHVGIPAAPISTAYSLQSQDHAKLKHCIAAITPAVIFADNGQLYAKTFATLSQAGMLGDVVVVVGNNPPADISTVPLSALLATVPRAQVDTAFAAITQDTICKILFTSGSTGLPKGVINTQRMVCSNQQATSQVLRFIGKHKPPVILDWLPWNHTFGGNHNFNMMLFHGGTLYIDGGKPAPGLIDQTIANLREVSPTLYLNVPRGFEMIVPALEQDAELRRIFFKDLELIFYAAASLPDNLWQRLEALSIHERGHKVMMISAWGSTETSPGATVVHWPIEQAGVIGLPLPGTEILLTPNGSKLELRVRGPNVTPGYWRNADQTAAAFDAEGFYRIGDAGKLLDANDARRGIAFDGRVAEDFKLSSGTWVSVGALRVKAVNAASPLIMDCAVAGHDRNEIGLLIFANAAACAKLTGKASLAEIAVHDDVRQALAAALLRYNKDNPGSSTRIARALILDSMPAIDANEITDKGYLNQRAVLEARADQVARLFAIQPDAAVIVL